MSLVKGMFNQRLNTEHMEIDMLSKHISIEPAQWQRLKQLKSMRYHSVIMHWMWDPLIVWCDTLAQSSTANISWDPRQ